MNPVEAGASDHAIWNDRNIDVANKNKAGFGSAQTGHAFADSALRAINHVGFFVRNTLARAVSNIRIMAISSLAKRPFLSATSTGAELHKNEKSQLIVFSARIVLAENAPADARDAAVKARDIVFQMDLMRLWLVRNWIVLVNEGWRVRVAFRRG